MTPKAETNRMIALRLAGMLPERKTAALEVIHLMTELVENYFERDVDDGTTVT
jgi:hypothetical protein